MYIHEDCRYKLYELKIYYILFTFLDADFFITIKKTCLVCLVQIPYQFCKLICLVLLDTHIKDCMHCPLASDNITIYQKMCF